jgi:hypothetical protein
VPEFGRLQNVPIREAWADEARDFTPWLLENADRLGEVLSMDLALHEAEHSVGSFSLDLLGEDLATGELVIVENQLERSDHRHLGQLLTYAAGVEASVVIWVADSFRDEHLATLRWLNTHTEDQIALFAVQVSVMQIDDSRKAPVFTVIERPNEWQRAIQASETPRVGMDHYLAFWQELIGYIAEKNPDWPMPRKAPRQAWLHFPGPIKGIHFRVQFRDGQLQVGLGLSSRAPGVNAALFKILEPMAGELQQQLHGTVEWFGPHSAWKGFNLDRQFDFTIEQAESQADKHIDLITDTLSTFQLCLHESSRMAQIEDLLTKNIWP